MVLLILLQITTTAIVTSATVAAADTTYSTTHWTGQHASAALLIQVWLLLTEMQCPIDVC